jgi:hypothetical protein
MAYLHLPVEHTEDDLALAGALASLLESEELYVAWSVSGGSSRPVIPAALRRQLPQPCEPGRPSTSLIGSLLDRIARRRAPRRA